VPANRHGLVSDEDAKRLHEFRERLNSEYADDLARLVDASASSIRGGSRRFDANRVLDIARAWGRCGMEDLSLRFWSCDDADPSPWIELRLPSPRRVDQVLLAESIAFGQRVKSFALEAPIAGKWTEIGRGTTIGRKRIVRTTSVETGAVRLRILDARAAPCLHRVGLFGGP
jgi:alpha-L-fucosidase